MPVEKAWGCISQSCITAAFLYVLGSSTLLASLEKEAVLVLDSHHRTADPANATCPDQHHLCLARNNSL